MDRTLSAPVANAIDASLCSESPLHFAAPHHDTHLDFSAPLFVISVPHASARSPGWFPRDAIGALATTHHASDRGAASLARALAERLDAKLVLADASRLFVDLNRALDGDARRGGDGSVALLEGDLGSVDLAGRRTLYHRFHGQLRREIAAGRAAGRPVIVIDQHSFTRQPENGPRRDVDVGVCFATSNGFERWGFDALKSEAETLSAIDGPLEIRRDEPYPGTHPGAFIGRNYGGVGVWTLTIEVCDDLLVTETQVARVADLLARALRRAATPSVLSALARERPSPGARRPPPTPPTLGIEEEFFVVSLADGAAVELPPAAHGALREAIGDRYFGEEYKQAQIELRTDIHDHPEALREDVLTLRFTAARVLANFGLGMAAAGTHPTADWRAMAAREGQRYSWIEQRRGDALRQLAVCGLHVHVGTFSCAEEQVARIAAYRPLIPVLIAAAPSSPFFVGRDTGHLSWRRGLLNSLGLQTVTRFESAAERLELLERLRHMGAVQADTDFWADIRPGTKKKPTVEVRCTDVSPYVDDGPTIAAVLQAYEAAFRAGRIAVPSARGESDVFFADYAMREAARYGGSAIIADPWTLEPIELRVLAERLIETLLPSAMELGTSSWLERFLELFHRPSPAERFREVAENAGVAGLRAVTDWVLATTQAAPTFAWPTHVDGSIACRSTNDPR